MFTFSQLVDDLISETKRPDLHSEIVRYVNQTVRELHFEPVRNSAIFYDENFREALVTTTTEDGMTWEIPDSANFQTLLVAAYPDCYSRLGEPVFATPTQPGRHMASLTHKYYRVGGAFVFGGYGGVGRRIHLGWYEFPRSLKYYPVASRPATYDVESGWSYPAGVNTPELQEAAREITTNWMLLRWSAVVSEGIRAKLYKRLSDTERARTSYSLYQSLRQGLWTSETAKLYHGV